MRIIFAIHGIRTKKSENWVSDFVDFAKKDPRFKDDVFVPYYYGFVFAVGSVIPFFKFQKVRQVKRALRKVAAEHPGCELNIVAHSYGTELSFWAVKTSGEDGLPHTVLSRVAGCHRGKKHLTCHTGVWYKGFVRNKG